MAGTPNSEPRSFRRVRVPLSLPFSGDKLRRARRQAARGAIRGGGKASSPHGCLTIQLGYHHSTPSIGGILKFQY
ncbi:hypothetical protein E2562_001894 [Oryza meyeriana var. granulata]|uniref:Uncharacterized protein n=1 Tax=Oryza meyeriana var. granulata TaxID=110450 RepID=A0A6G1C445_9ORYZ|nr:hypothetical protein E2562_001894 [Oryza meyeriana var. granulata]